MCIFATFFVCKMILFCAIFVVNIVIPPSELAGMPEEARNKAREKETEVFKEQWLTNLVGVLAIEAANWVPPSKDSEYLPKSKLEQNIEDASITLHTVAVQFRDAAKEFQTACWAHQENDLRMKQAQQRAADTAGTGNTELSQQCVADMQQCANACAGSEQAYERTFQKFGETKKEFERAQRAQAKAVEKHQQQTIHENIRKHLAERDEQGAPKGPVSADGELDGEPWKPKPPSPGKLEEGKKPAMIQLNMPINKDISKDDDEDDDKDKDQDTAVPQQTQSTTLNSPTEAGKVADTTAQSSSDMDASNKGGSTTTKGESTIAKDVDRFMMNSVAMGLDKEPERELIKRPSPKKEKPKDQEKKEEKKEERRKKEEIWKPPPSSMSGQVAEATKEGVIPTLVIKNLQKLARLQNSPEISQALTGAPFEPVTRSPSPMRNMIPSLAQRMKAREESERSSSRGRPRRHHQFSRSKTRSGVARHSPPRRRSRTRRSRSSTSSRSRSRSSDTSRSSRSSRSRRRTSKSRSRSRNRNSHSYSRPRASGSLSTRGRRRDSRRRSRDRDRRSRSRERRAGRSKDRGIRAGGRPPSGTTRRRSGKRSTSRSRKPFSASVPEIKAAITIAKEGTGDGRAMAKVGTNSPERVHARRRSGPHVPAPPVKTSTTGTMHRVSDEDPQRKSKMKIQPITLKSTAHKPPPGVGKEEGFNVPDERTRRKDSSTGHYRRDRDDRYADDKYQRGDRQPDSRSREEKKSEPDHDYDYGKDAFPISFDDQTERQVVRLIKAKFESRGGFSAISPDERDEICRTIRQKTDVESLHEKDETSPAKPRQPIVHSSRKRESDPSKSVVDLTSAQNALDGTRGAVKSFQAQENRDDEKKNRDHHRARESSSTDFTLAAKGAALRQQDEPSRDRWVASRRSRTPSPNFSKAKGEALREEDERERRRHSRSRSSSSTRRRSGSKSTPRLRSRDGRSRSHSSHSSSRRRSDTKRRRSGSSDSHERKKGRYKSPSAFHDRYSMKSRSTPREYSIFHKLCFNCFLLYNKL